MQFSWNPSHASNSKHHGLGPFLHEPGLNHNKESVECEPMTQARAANLHQNMVWWKLTRLNLYTNEKPHDMDFKGETKRSGVTE